MGADEQALRRARARHASARDLFEAVRKASRDAGRISRQLKAMEAREGVRAQGYEPRGRSGRLADVTDRVDARMDFEEAKRAQLEADYEAIDAACEVLYGTDGRSGLWLAMGGEYADVLWWRYLADATWDAVSRMVGRSATWCKQACWVALDEIDSVGLEATVAGRSVSE